MLLSKQITVARMGAGILSIEGSQVKLEVSIALSRSMLRSEENIQQSLNEGGCLATLAALKYLDTDGSAIEIAGEVMRTKGEHPKGYQTPYGEVVVHLQTGLWLSKRRTT